MKSFSGNRKWVWLGLTTLLLVLAGWGYAKYRHTFPYGWSHCCIKILSGNLEIYADRNEGRYPAGQSSPEASLSLLHRTLLTPAGILRGKTVPEKLVDKILREGGLLGPDTCGWHYVEGLNTNDDDRIAIVWDKVGLGHDGQRSDSHEVAFIGGSVESIPKNHWDFFQAEQEELLASRATAKQRGRPVLRATVIGSALTGIGIEYPFKLYVRTHPQRNIQNFTHRSFEAEPTEPGFKLMRQGEKLTPAALTWYADEVPTNGVWELALVVEEHYAWEALVAFRDGKPDQEDIFFEVNRLKGTR